MKQRCIEAVTKAAGRTLTQVELKDIETRISRNRRQLAQTDRESYLTMTPEMQLQEAAKMASEEFIADAIKKRQRVALTIQKHDRIDTYMKQQKDLHGLSGMDTLNRILAVFNDGKSFNKDSAITESVETRAHAISNDYIRQLHEAFETLQPKYIGLFQNKKAMDALVRTLYGEDIGTKVDTQLALQIKEAAKAWTEVTDLARQHFNNAGGEVGKLEDWHMPQSHSQQFVAKAGQDNWVKDMMTWYNPKRYVNDDGSYMNTQQISDLFKEIWVTIATGGANKIEPGRIAGRGMLANAHAESRSIHFKDANSYLAYQAKYGKSDPYTTMMGHVNKLSADIAMIETMGPNPDAQFKYWLDQSYQDDVLNNPADLGKITAQRTKADNLYNYVAGKTQPVANWKIAQGFDTLRNWLIATKLGSSYITSITDNGTMHLTAQVNNLSSMQLMRNQLSTLNPFNSNELRIARRAGLSLQTLVGEMNRWGAESLGPTFSAKMANLTIRASLLNAATEARRRAFGVTMYGSIGNVVNEHPDIHSIDSMDKRMLESKGVNDTTFQVWKKAQLEDWGGGNDTILTPDAIYRIPDSDLQGLGNPNTLRREAALKLIGMTNEEINMAVIEPGAREREITKMGTQRGTWKGEIARSFFLFKSFPLATIMKHWERAFSYEGKASKASYLGAFIAGTTILGAASQQIKNLLAGRDPQDMTKGKFWAASLMQGGSLGIYGDFLLNTQTSYGSSPLSVLAGPVAGYTEDLIGLTQGNLIRAAKGEKTHAAAEAIHMLKNNIPLQNLWYTKAITDRLIFNHLQEIVSPGYMNRIESRARKDFNQSYYYRPGEAVPHRAPDFARALPH